MLRPDGPRSSQLAGWQKRQNRGGQKGVPSLMGDRSRILNSRLVAGRDARPWLSGSIHYWRLEPVVWAKALQAIKGLGFEMICTYIPWSVHEVRRGVFDFGEKDPKKEVERFLRLAGDMGLWAIVRPGPHINSELTYFGFPKRLLKMEHLLARSATGTPVFLPAPFRAFPVPSYASEAFYEELSLYFDALAPRLRPLLSPDGPVVAVQADNEMSLFFRMQPFDQDYSEEAVALYRTFLREHYGDDLGTLRRTHRCAYRAFDDVVPPRTFSASSFRSLPRYTDWAKFKAHLIRYGVQRVRRMLEQRGLTALLYTHNYPTPFPQTPLEVWEMEKEVVDVQGMDSYPTRRDYLVLKKGGQYLSTMSRLPASCEFSSGFVAFSPTVTLRDQKFTAPTLLMHGIKGINFYMLVERDRWCGSPITRRGNLRPEYARFFREFTDLYHRLSIPDLEGESAVLLLLPRLYRQVELVSSLFSPLPIDLISEVGGLPRDLGVREDRLGLEVPPALCFVWFEDSWYRFLHIKQVPFQLGSDELRLSDLYRYRVLIVPTLPFAPSPLVRLCSEYVATGGTLIAGPCVPRYDERMMPARFELFDGVETAGQRKTRQALGLSWRLCDAVKVHRRREVLVDQEGTPVAAVKRHGKGKMLFFAGIPTIPQDGCPQDLADWWVSQFSGYGLGRFSLTADGLDHAVRKSDERCFLFLANATGENQTTQIKSADGRAYVLNLDGEDRRLPLQVTLPPYTVRVFEFKEETAPAQPERAR